MVHTLDTFLTIVKAFGACLSGFCGLRAWCPPNRSYNNPNVCRIVFSVALRRIHRQKGLRFKSVGGRSRGRRSPPLLF